MKMIRWQGLAAFTVIVAGLALAFYLFAATLIKWGIEAGGESSFNAKVDVQSVVIDYSPTRLAIHGMTVADESEAMQNLFEFEVAQFGIDLLKLLMGQVIIEDLTLQGLALGTARAESGLLPTSKASAKTEQPSSSTTDDVKDSFKEAASAAPDAKTLLAREPLQTDAAYNALNASIDEKKAQWDTLKSDLPDSEKLKNYEVQIKQLLEGDLKSVQDFQQRKAKLKKIKKAMKADKKALAQAKKVLSTSQSELKQQLTALKNAPQADYQHLKNKYGLNAGGVANISGLLFGGKVGDYSHTFLHWYNKAEPLIARAKAMKSEASADTEEPQRLTGRFVRFPEHNPQPDFIINKAQLSVITDSGLIDARLRDVTHQQHIINRPTTLTLTAEQLENIRGLKVDAILDHRQEPAVDSAQLNIKALEIADQQLSDSERLSMTLKQATAVVEGSAVLTEGQLKGNVTGLFNDAELISTGKSRMAKEMGDAISSMQSFDLNVAFAGAVDELDIDINSNIDKQMKSAFNKRLKAKQKQWQAKLDKALQEKLNGYLQDLDPNLGLADTEASLTGDIDQLDHLLKTQLEDYEAQQKAEAKKKAKAEKSKQKSKAKDKLKSLF